MENFNLAIESINSKKNNILDLSEKRSINVNRPNTSGHLNFENFPVSKHTPRHNNKSSSSSLSTSTTTSVNFDQFNEKMISIHCVVEMISVKKTDENSRKNLFPNIEDSCKIEVPLNANFNDLTSIVLQRLGFRKYHIYAAKGFILIKNWKPINIDDISNKFTNTIGDILDNLTSIVTLKIQIFYDKINPILNIKDKLLRFLLFNSYELLVKSECPLDNHFLNKLATSITTDELPSVECQEKFEYWWKKQSELSKTHLMKKNQKHFQQIFENKTHFFQRFRLSHETDSYKENNFHEYNPIQKTRIRTSFDQELELPKLLNWFHENNHPSRQQIQQYVIELNQLESRKTRKPLDVHNVVYWFKNARAAQKRSELRNSFNFNNETLIPKSNIESQNEIICDDSDDQNEINMNHETDFKQTETEDENNSSNETDKSLHFEQFDSKLSEKSTSSFSLVIDDEDDDENDEDDDNNDQSPKNANSEINNSDEKINQEIELDNDDNYNDAEMNTDDDNDNNNDYNNDEYYKDYNNRVNEDRKMNEGYFYNHNYVNETSNTLKSTSSEYNSIYLKNNTVNQSNFHMNTSNGDEKKLINLNFLRFNEKFDTNSLLNAPIAQDEKRKRNRTFIDPVSEVPKLEHWFQLNSHPVYGSIVKYTEQLNKMPYRSRYPKLEAKNIQFWFKNRRAKDKRLKLAHITESQNS